jgi:hypothetical protein
MQRTSIGDLELSGHELAEEQLRLATGTRWTLTSKVTSRATFSSKGSDVVTDIEFDF